MRKIKIIGVGGAGNNVIDRIIESNGTTNVEFVAVSSCETRLKNSKATNKVSISHGPYMGLGQTNPERHAKHAKERSEEIAQVLSGADAVIIVAGMGGGDGTGASPVISGIAKEQGILTIGVVSKPFSFEGKRRMENAKEGIENLLGNVDMLLVIPYDKLRDVFAQKLTFANAFDIADGVLHHAITSLCSLLTQDFGIFGGILSDLRNAGYAQMGCGQAAGDGRAEAAARSALANPFWEASIAEAKIVIVNITGSTDMELVEVEAAIDIVKEAVNSDATIYFNSVHDESIDEGVNVTIIAAFTDDMLAVIMEHEAIEGVMFERMP